MQFRVFGHTAISSGDIRRLGDGDKEDDGGGGTINPNLGSNEQWQRCNFEEGQQRLGPGQTIINRIMIE